MTEMIELIRTLIKDKGQSLGSDPQNETAQHDQRREELVYQARFTPPYALNVHVAHAPLMQQVGGFPYDYSRENTVDPITIPNLDDPKEQEKI